MSSDERLSFTVDTHLLRELGALLVGRESTALVELIKNAYDADATIVTVHGSDLETADGQIVVSDNGTGMTFERFQTAFLRIAGRSKEQGDRRSKRYQRRYTGEKGIGRLAAHKLAAKLTVESTPDLPPAQRTGSTDDTATSGIRAQLFWDRMEDEHNDLTDLGSALTARRLPVLPTSVSGTTMTLSGTRGAWDDRRLDPFLREVRGCRPPAVLVEQLPEGVLTESLLFRRPVVNEHGKNDPGMRLDLTGQFDGGDELWKTMAERANWVIEIDSQRTGLRYGIAPTAHHLAGQVKRGAKQEWLTDRVISRRHPNPKAGPFFQARILVFEGTFGRQRSELATFARRESGVRVFMEGFRVLPYGSAGDDWLKVDRDYVVRARDLGLSSLIDDEEFAPVDDETFFLIGNRGYFGAVMLTEEGSPGLDMVVNREGFVPGPSYEQLTELVRAGLDLSVRARAALGRRMKELKAAEKEAEEKAKLERARQEAEEQARREAEQGASDEPDDDSSPNDLATTPDDSDEAAGSDDERDSDPETVGGDEDDDTPEAGRLRDLLADADSAAAALAGDLPPPQRKARVAQLEATLSVLKIRLGSLRDEQLVLRLLAGVGTQYAAFVHEVNGLLGQAQGLRSSLDELASQLDFPRAERSLLKDIQAAAEELVQSLTRQASYLTDVVGPDARRRRRRMPFNDRVESALRLVTSRLNEREQQLVIDVPDDLKTPPLFPAEMAIILTNLLSNSIKFAGHGGRILVSASLDDLARMHLMVANTGARVARKDFERFFQTFESSTEEVDVVLGQGMGMGLPIVRSLVESYDGTAMFVPPPPGYSTAVEVILPDPRRPPRGNRAA